MNIKREQLDADAVRICERLRHANHVAYVVGGCVRDLLLGRKPKDFDVVTSATPPDLRRLFRNCRIIGRRFRLAHIFFGNKIIETSTFRANPREIDDAEEGAAPAEDRDLLIKRDNVFGTIEEDARRRDFTINALFYDVEKDQVIDHVGGMADLEARLVRTIGDPAIRFREDPIRILRAVKFAARCDLTIEPETYRQMLELAGEVSKCAEARVSEEFFRLMRGGAARRSMELLVETSLLGVLAPDLARALSADSQDDDTTGPRKARFWAYLEALDRSVAKRDQPPSNALILATMLLPPLRDALHPDTNSIRDIGRFVADSIAQLMGQLKAGRREADLARQILLATRYIFPSGNPNRKRPHLAGREFLDDALRLAEIVSEAETAQVKLAGRPLIDGDEPPIEASGDEAGSELESLVDAPRRGRYRGGRGRERGASTAAARPHVGPRLDTGSEGPARIPDLLLPVEPAFAHPAFLGAGPFGGRWGSRLD